MINAKANEVLWVEKYRPQQIADTILPEQMKETFRKFVADGNIPNLLLTGGPGVGKTTIAKAMLDELGCDYIVKNGSLNVNIDTLRYDISTFASAVSLTGTGRKYVIFDEADYLNTTSVQPALRNFIEEYSSNCGFIFTCNFKNRIIGPLRSRLSEVDFGIEIKELDNILRLTDFKKHRTSFDLGEVSFHSGWVFHRAGANTTNKTRKVMTVIYMDGEMKLKFPDNENQTRDMEKWCPGTSIGEIIDSPLNPILFP